MAEAEPKKELKEKKEDAPKEMKEKFTSRTVAKKILSVEQGEGAGARVRRSIGGYSLRNFDPFLMLDEFKVGAPAGFPDHPHRGFETVTYMLPTSPGGFQHEDFVGHRGDLEAGDLQWMTAGRGIMHSEMPKSKDQAHGLQLWINLSKADKLCEPKYQELKKEKLTTVTKGDVTAIVIAGEALGIKSPVYTLTPVHYIHFILKAGATLQHFIPQGWNSFAYVIEGEGKFGGTESDAHHTLALDMKGDGLTVTTTKGVNFVLISGKPINEPVVQYGPFVMTSQQEIRQAMLDFQMGKNGFERAPGWYSKIGLPLTKADQRQAEED